MPKLDDKTGKRFGRLVVLELARKEGKVIFWRCRCDCGTVKEIQASTLSQKGRTTFSCGCAKSELIRDLNRTHGKSWTAEYGVYYGMLKRCRNSKCRDYPNYGGRGITVCERWIGENGFEHFLADMGTRPSTAHSIEREDTNGPYSPTNCRWAMRIDQCNNRRTNVRLEFQGETRTIAEWSRSRRISGSIIIQRIYKLGWTVEQALTEPVANIKRGFRRAKV